MSEDAARAYLRSLGFRDAAATDRHLQSIADDVVVREALGRIAGDLLPALLESPHPDEAVATLASYLAARTGRAMFLDYLAEDPRALHVLSSVFGSSRILSEILIRNPEYFHWLVAQIERSVPDRQDLEDDLETMLPASGEAQEIADGLRRWQWREILRVGTCDLLRRETVPSISRQLSDLAEVSVNRALSLARPGTEGGGDALAVIALGALGGREMSYASPVELMCVFDAPVDQESVVRDACRQLERTLAAFLRGDDRDPFYRTVEVRVQSTREVRESYASSESMADRVMLLKARPIGGDPAVARQFLETIRPFVFRDALDAAISAGAQILAADVKEDAEGMVRCVEGSVQALQLAHGARLPAVRQPGTLDALSALASEGVITASDARELTHAYEFLKGVIHTRQLTADDATPASGHLERQLPTYHANVQEICRKLCGTLED